MNVNIMCYNAAVNEGLNKTGTFDLSETRDVHTSSHLCFIEVNFDYIAVGETTEILKTSHLFLT